MSSTVLAILRNHGRLASARSAGNSTLLETSAGVRRIEGLARAVPDTVYQRWARAGDLIMHTFLVWWGCLFASIPVLATFQFGTHGLPSGPDFHTGIGAAAVASFVTVFETVVPMVGEHWVLAAVSTSLGVSAALLGVGLVLLYLIIWGVFLVTLVFSVPHEFGHIVAMVNNGARVEGYGLVLAGAFPVGLYVRSDADRRAPGEYTALAERQIAAAGVTNDTLLATAFGLLAGVCYVLVSEPLGQGVLVIAGAWVVSAATNSLPVQGLDGGQYLSGRYRQSWLAKAIVVIDPERLEF